jgi:hypothetical protein
VEVTLELKKVEHTMFKKENAPYLFTLIIATLGWLLTRAVDEVTKSPLVAYTVHESVNVQGGREFTVRVHNISRATAFRNLYVVLTNLDGVRSKFTDANAEYEAPAHVSEERKTTAGWGNTWAGILLKDLQPESAVRLATRIEGPDTPLVRCESATDTVRLVEENWHTWLVEEETGILLWLALILVLLLIFYVVCLARAKPAASVTAIAVPIALFASGVCSAGTLRVVDDATGRGVQCSIYREDENAQRHRATRTNRNGVCSITDSGKAGEKYVAVSEEYNPNSVECPVVNATIRVRRTVWLRDHLAKAEFLNSGGSSAAAALELRKASLIAEKHNDTKLFNQLEYGVVENAAKALGVEKPFVETAAGLRTSEALKTTVREYQKDRDLKPTGVLNSDTIRELAANGPAFGTGTGSQPGNAGRAAETTGSPR